MQSLFQNSIRQCQERRTDNLLIRGKMIEKVKSDKLGPIVICPGLGGTCLDFELDSTVGIGDCSGFLNNIILKFKKILWINPIGLSLQRDCFLTLLKPVYDKLRQTLSNIQGLKTTVHGQQPGDVLASQCLSYILETSTCFPETSYAQNFINFFTKAGYVANKNLLIVGYDFRLVPYPNYCQMYFTVLQQVIESAYIQNNKNKVNLVGHSLGCSLINIFLNTRRRQWKKRYIAKFFPISPAYDGGPEALSAVLSGNNFGLSANLFGSNLDFREAERHMAGVIATIPLHSQMYSGSELEDGTAIIFYKLFQSTINTNIFVEKKYNVNDYKNGIIDILQAVAQRTNQKSLKTTALILSKIRKQRQKYGWKDPHLPVYQLMVVDTPTPGGAYAYDLSNNGLNTDPTTCKMVLGDGIIPRYGLYIPKLYNWKNIHFQIYPSSQANHSTLFTDCPSAYSYILSIINS